MPQGTEAIRCPSCGHENPPDSRFCSGCGAELTRTCPECGRENPPGGRFCNGCGRELSEADGTARPPAPEHLAAKIRASAGALAGERKQVTVLFCDVVGSMGLSERTDPEAWQGIMERFFALVCDAVHRFEGTVDKFTGDGAMAIFGAPIAHEDHAARACHAALHLSEELASLSAELRREHRIELSVRIGLNSGEVVVGAIGADLEMDYTAIGHTVGLAERTERLAEPGKVYLTEHTARLVEGYVELAELGERTPTGAAPVRVYELRGPGEATGRIEATRGRGLTRFVGREREIDALEEAREQALGGSAQVVGIVGEAGVGKSRLCFEFAERCRERGMPVYRVAGQAHARSVPLLPVLALLREYFGIKEGDSDEAAREKITDGLVSLDPAFEEELPLLFDFLSVPDPERPAERMDPEARQRRVLALLRRLARAQNAREPAATMIEDLHWLDPASEAFLANHVEALQGTRGLTVVDFRPDYHAEWMSHTYYRQLALAPLRGEATELLLADLLGSDPSLDGLVELIGERSGGNPFFCEEIVQDLVEEGSLVGERGARRLVREVEDTEVPATVQAVLAARIDRLAERDKAVLGAASVLGREFAAPVLEDVAELSPEELSEALGALVAAEFVHLHELTPEETYAFKHPLTQLVAYRSQLERRRIALHARAAGAIARHYPQRLDELAALLADHREAAGEQLEAARQHARAGAWAGTGDPAAALYRWRRVRELADELPTSEETTALGLAARTYQLGFGWRLGIAPEEAAALFGEAERIAARAGDVRSRALLLANYGGIKAISEGELVEAARLGREAIALAEEAGDPALYLALVNSPGYQLWLIGEYRESLAVAERGIELAGNDPTVGAGIGLVCPLAWCHGFRGFNLTYLGELEEAARAIARGREIAREHRDTEVLGWSHLWSCMHGYLAGEPEAAHRHARQAVEIAERIGDSFSRSLAWLLLGMAERMRGRWRAAIEALERSRTISDEHRAAVEIEPRPGAGAAGLGGLRRAGRDRGGARPRA